MVKIMLNGYHILNETGESKPSLNIEMLLFDF